MTLPTLVTGVLAVAVLALGSRALHLDGLSDTVDGLTASYDRERSLAVMRTGTSGPAGTAALGNPNGVVIFSSSVQVGGTAAGAGNVISGNNDNGLVLAGSRRLTMGQGDLFELTWELVSTTELPADQYDEDEEPEEEDEDARHPR